MGKLPARGPPAARFPFECESPESEKSMTGEVHRFPLDGQSHRKRTACPGRRFISPDDTARLRRGQPPSFSPSAPIAPKVSYDSRILTRTQRSRRNASRTAFDCSGFSRRRGLAPAGSVRKYIVAGRVSIDGEVKRDLGTRVDPRRQRVSVDGHGPSARSRTATSC